MQPWLAWYPIQEITQFITDGCSIVDNWKSVSEFPEIVQDKVAKEIDFDESLSSVSYSYFEEAILKIGAFGQGALMAKANIKSAF